MGKGPVEAEGKTVKEAIAKGLKILGATRSQVSVKVLVEESRGLFGMRGTNPARVRVSMKREAP
ncbi:MAG: Jag N-terminal domain-containing protein [Candidatus Omnitrophica bacterium]|nr:Jag N-terminal domain-containing protein [Candidatus Omnitrophota bacterium]